MNVMFWFVWVAVSIMFFFIGWWLTGRPLAGHRPDTNAGVGNMEGHAGDVQFVVIVGLLTFALFGLDLIFDDFISL